MANKPLEWLRSKSALVVLGILGVCLIMFSSLFSSVKKEEQDDISFYTELLEKRVEELILEMNSVESVSVLITLENSGEIVFAQNQTSNSSEYVLFSTDKGENGLKLAEINPTVRGVAVVCSNGDNPTVKEKITSMLSSALGIPTNRITVTG